MYTQEQAREKLKKSIDRLGPGMWLRVDGSGAERSVRARRNE